MYNYQKIKHRNKIARKKEATKNPIHHRIDDSTFSYHILHFFHRQLDFSSEPGVANVILENEAKGCLTVA